jgi:cob(I)alamin adenosyltransferase
MAQNDVATLQAEFSHATSMFEMWELNGLAQTAVAQRTEELAKAVTAGGDKAAAAIDNVKQATDGLKTSVDTVKDAVTSGGDKAAAAIDNVKQATDGLKASVDTVKDAVTSGGDKAAAAIDNVKQATDGLKASVDTVKDAVKDGAERIAGAIYELTSELRNLCPVLDKGGIDRGAGSAFRQDEYFRISASENADEVMRAHLEQLEKTVDEAIRREKLAAFLEHIQRWEDLGSSPNQQRRRRK